MDSARSALKLELRGVVKRFGDHAGAAVNGLTTGVAEGRMLVLLGPSGCGKTTTLHIVAGLLHPDEGGVVIDGQVVAGAGWGWPPERRNLGMVFQSYAVWPHKTVFENVAYGLNLRRVSSEDLGRRVDRALETVQLGGLAKRYPSELSGGQQQRVALARAIVVDPSLLLLDEPLSNLDATLREQMRVELKGLQRQLGLTAIYVTHDQAEAMVLADHLVIMRNGAIEQEGVAEHVFSRPRSRFVATFLGTTNILDGRIVDVEGDVGRLDVPGLGVVHGYVGAGIRSQLSAGASAALAVRSIALTLSRARPDRGLNRFEGRISQRVFLGDITEYAIRTGGSCWRAQALSSQSLPSVGDGVWMSFDPDAATIVVDT
jgi:ABC-type Fe3+/spermidine/putrescine transport system ATPase subunit